MQSTISRCLFVVVAISASLLTWMGTSGGVALARDPAVTATTSIAPYSPDIPNSGRISALAVRPSDDRQILAASETGGLFASDDGGTSWYHRNDLASTSVQDVKFVGSHDLVVASTAPDFESGRGGGGIYTATGRDTFARADNVFPAAGSSCPERPAAHGIAIEPGTHEIYVGTDCGYASADATVTFHHHTIPGASDQDIEDMAALGGGHLIAGGPSMGVWYSSDNGAHWNQETTGIGDISDIHALAADPRDNEHAFAVNNATDLYQTADGGRTWQQITAPEGAAYCGGIANVHAVMESGVEKLYFGNHCDTMVATLQQDGTWSSWTALEELHRDTRDLSFHVGTNAPYLLSSDGGVLRATDDTHFSWVGGPAHGLDALQVTEVSGQYVPGQVDPTLYFATQDNSVWAMNGSSTTTANSVCCEGFFFGMPRVVTPSTHNRINYTVCSYTCQNQISDPGLASPSAWNDAEAGVGSPRFLSPYQYVEAVNNAGGFTQGLQYTSDEGAHWTQIANIPEPLFGLPQVSGGAGNPTLTQPVYIGTRASDGTAIVQLARVTDFSSGGTGTLRYTAHSGFGSLGVTPTMFAWYEVFAVDPTDSARIIAADVFHGDVRETTDGGDSWSVIPGATDLIGHSGTYAFSERVNNRLVPNASVISYCPDNTSRVLMGTHRGGAYFSYDGGQTWVPVSHSDALTYGTSVFWLSNCGAAYMSTYGRGIFRINMALHTSTIPTSGNCAPVICRLREILLQYHAPPRPGCFITDGYISRVVRRSGGNVIHVTPGSVVSFYRKRPSNLKVVVDKGLVQPEKNYEFAVFFRHHKVVRTLSAGSPIPLYPQAQGTLGKGLDHPRRTPKGSIQISSPAVADGTEFPLIQPGGDLSIKAFIAQPSNYPVVLSIDGLGVAKGEPGAKEVDFFQKPQTWPQGAHAVEIYAEAPKGRQYIAGSQFYVTHGDKD